MLEQICETDLDSVPEVELEIVARILVRKLSQKHVVYLHADAVLSEYDEAANRRMMKYAFENFGMKVAEVVYGFFCKIGTNANRVVIIRIAKRYGWKLFPSTTISELMGMVKDSKARCLWKKEGQRNATHHQASA